MENINWELEYEGCDSVDEKVRDLVKDGKLADLDKAYAEINKSYAGLRANNDNLSMSEYREWDEYNQDLYTAYFNLVEGFPEDIRFAIDVHIRSHEAEMCSPYLRG